MENRKGLHGNIDKTPFRQINMDSRRVSRGSLGSLPDQLPIPSLSTTTNEDNVDVKKLLHGKLLARKKYFTSGSKVNKDNAEDLEKSRPFDYPEEFEEFAHKVMTKAWRNDVKVKEHELKCVQKPCFRERQQTSLLNRLYVEEAPITSVKTVLDVDPQYFKIIRGRPIPDKLDIREYIQTVRDTLRNKIIEGYREDDIMLIEENLISEQKKIDTIRENYQTYVNTFEEFLYKDHSSAMQLLKESEQAANAAYDKYEEYKKLAKKYGAMRSSLYNSEEKWRNCKMYQKFLYLVSPLSWRASRQKYRRASIYIIDTDEDDESENIFGKYRVSVAEKGASLRDIIQIFRQESMNEEAPQLYFTDPEQLLEVFRFMEVQNLNSLLHSEELAVPLENVGEGMKVAEELFDYEISQLRSNIESLSGGISWEEERARYLEKLGKNLIENEFKSLVMDDSVLNLHVYVEDVYETRIGPNDANLSMLKMMKAIEEKYRHELLSLDKVPSEQVQMLEGSCYVEQMRVMRLAEKAAKQYAQLEQLTNTLNRAFAPPFKRVGGKETKKRSPPIDPPQKSEPAPRKLTEKEEEYLEYFTDFCKETDDPERYGIDTRTENVPLTPAFFDSQGDRSRYGRIQRLAVVERMIMTNT
ncbi:hypothetical protein JTB14_029504 [Gonioctena quinquepunctata]|nr:hypothetical protein JTB14_029504 [Gonioctena quinquepunctata]